MNRYIHLGADIDVPENDIVGIFDIERVTVSGSARDFLARSQKRGSVYYVSLDMPKCFIVTDTQVLVTNVAARTIKKRII